MKKVDATKPVPLNRLMEAIATWEEAYNELRAKYPEEVYTEAQKQWQLALALVLF